jgi:hypothetical protein
VAEDDGRGAMLRPWHIYAGRYKRIFSDGEEAALVSFVQGNFIAPDLIFTDSDFRDIATSAGPDMHMFQCSAEFIPMFKT